MPADGMPATSQGAGAVRRARRAPGQPRGHRVRGKAPWPGECWQRARQSPRTRAQTRALLGDGAGVPVAITLWRLCSRQSGNMSLWGNPAISQMVGQAGRHRQPLARVKFLSKFRAERCRAPAPSSRDLVWPVPRPREPVGHRPPPGPPQRHRGTPEAEGSAPKFMNMHGARAGAELRADQTGTDRSPCRCRSLPRARPPPFTTTVRRRVHYSDETTGEASGRAESAASPPPTSHAPQEVSGAGSLQQREHICLCQR